MRFSKHEGRERGTISRLGGANAMDEAMLHTGVGEQKPSFQSDIPPTINT